VSAPGQIKDPAVLYRFAVEVDGLDLGAYTECRGLAATYSVDAIVEGGSLAPTGHLLKGVSYADVVLIRPLDESSGTVAAWFSGFADNPAPTTARITAKDPSGATICAWDLQGVVPKQWSGPQWSVKGNDVAMESLTLAHTGFAPAGVSLSLDVSASLGVSASLDVSAGLDVTADVDVSAGLSAGGGLGVG
jgi:phage tail-like protein